MADKPKNWFSSLMDMDAGLVKVSSINKATAQAKLPEQNLVISGCGDRRIDEQLARVLNVKTIGSDLLQQLNPKYYGTSFIPEEYKKTLEVVIQDLKKEKKDIKDRKLFGIYQEVEALLVKETENSDLLEEFRMTLLQG